MALTATAEAVQGACRPYLFRERGENSTLLNQILFIRDDISGQASGE
jgi:hypothetical protein